MVTSMNGTNETGVDCDPENSMFLRSLKQAGLLDAFLEIILCTGVSLISPSKLNTYQAPTVEELNETLNTGQ
jgi:hypothetical protein